MKAFSEQIVPLVQMKAVSTSQQAVGKHFWTRPSFFEVLIQVINTVLGMHAGFVASGPLAFLMSGRFNQDCVENLFSQTRAKVWHHLRRFHFAYRILCSDFTLARIPSANCPFDNDVMMTSSARISIEVCTSNTRGPSSKSSRLAEDE